MINHNYNIGYVTGVFDLLHEGHLNLLLAAKEKCEKLIVGVSTDELVEEYKGYKPFVPLGERIKEIEELPFVFKVVVQDSLDKMKKYDELKFDVYFHGDDILGTDLLKEYYDSFSGYDIEIKLLPYTSNISSTKIKSNVDDFIFEEISDGYRIKKYVGNSKIVVTPSTYNGKKVHSVENRAFAFSNIEKLYLSDNIVSIGTECFYSSNNLTRVYLNNLENAGIGCFARCENLKTVVFPIKDFEVSRQMFYECVNLIELHNFSSVIRICKDAFFGCNNVVEYKNGYSCVYNWVIDSFNEIQYIILDDNIVGIADLSFTGNDKLQNIKIGENVKYIGRFAFDGTGIWNNSDSPIVYADNWIVGIKSDIYECVILKNTVGLSDMSFAGNKNIKKIVFPTEIKHIGKDAFKGCINLELLENFDSQLIDDYSFEGCYCLKHEN